MGMAAGQARLLSITARLSDNEQNGQALSFAKQRLADEADQINREYNEALNATKLTVLTGFNGAEAQYTDISYGLLTDYNKLIGGKQYLVTNQKGQILVTKEIADAFKKGNGDFNIFINDLGLSQNDVDFAAIQADEYQTKAEKQYQVVHDAWDRYLTSVGKSFEDIEHNFENNKVQFVWATKDGKGNDLTLENQYPYVQTLKTKPVSNIKTSSVTNYGTPWGIKNLTVDDENNFILSMEFTNIDEDGNPLIPTLAADKTYTMRMFTGTNSNEPVGFTSNCSRNPDYAMVITDEEGVQTNYWLTIRENEEGKYEFNITQYDKDNKMLLSKDVPAESIHSTGETSGYVLVHQGKATQYWIDSQNWPLNYDGTTVQQRELYEYAVAVTKAYAGQDDCEKSIAKNPENAAEIQYYRNIYNQMMQFGFVEEADLKINMNVTKLGMRDSNWFEQQLRQGKLLLKTYDASKGDFVNTTYSEDSTIQEVEDDRKIAKAAADYDQAQAALERKDKKIDLELKKLDTEHNALQTEYESVKSVVDKNIEKSFNIFS